MENEFIKTIDIMKKEKNKIIDKLNQEIVEELEKIKLYKNLIFLDENINMYTTKINECKYYFFKLIIINNFSKQ